MKNNFGEFELVISEMQKEGIEPNDYELKPMVKGLTALLLNESIHNRQYNLIMNFIASAVNSYMFNSDNEYDFKGLHDELLRNNEQFGNNSYLLEPLSIEYRKSILYLINGISYLAKNKDDFLEKQIERAKEESEKRMNGEVNVEYEDEYPPFIYDCNLEPVTNAERMLKHYINYPFELCCMLEDIILNNVDVEHFNIENILQFVGHSMLLVDGDRLLKDYSYHKSCGYTDGYIEVLDYSYYENDKITPEQIGIDFKTAVKTILIENVKINNDLANDGDEKHNKEILHWHLDSKHVDEFLQYCGQNFDDLFMDFIQDVLYKREDLTPKIVSEE